MNVRSSLAGLMLLLSVVTSTADDMRKPAAFPGAEGFGAQAIGGRGGRVIEVINLNDDGPGSLRAAVEAEGRRIVVFRIAGIIELRSELVLANPYITIAGQTAPGGGVTIKTHPSNSRSALTIKGGAHDVILQHLRIRPEPPTKRERPDDDSHVQDALQILDASRVIVDHCSFSWATDEVISTFSSAQDVSIQWCIIAEALRNKTRGGVDGKGLLVGGPKAGRISIHHNLMAHNLGRSPMVKLNGLADVVNNVAHVPGVVAMSISDEYAPTKANFIANYVTAPNGDGIVRGCAFLPTGKGFRVYAQGNLGPHLRDADGNQSLWFRNIKGDFLGTERHATPQITEHTAEEAWRLVLDHAGATRPHRDAVDARVVADVKAGRSRIVDHPNQVGGWSDIPMSAAPSDSDHDGMPDIWEAEHGFNPGDASDGTSDADGDGYTNVEEYLNRTHPRRKQTGD